MPSQNYVPNSEHKFCKISQLYRKSTRISYGKWAFNSAHTLTEMFSFNLSSITVNEMEIIVRVTSLVIDWLQHEETTEVAHKGVVNNLLMFLY